MRGPEDSALYGVMLRWADKHPQRDALYNEKNDLNHKDFGNLWEIRAFFLRLDARFVQKRRGQAQGARLDNAPAIS